MTIFQKILDGDIESAKIYEDELIYVFMDAFPQSRGHALIIPKQAERDLFTMPVKTLAHIIEFSQRLAKAQMQALSADGIRVMQFNGEAAGQSVFHYHMHLIPMWHEQDLEAHGDQSVALEQLQDIAKKISAALEA
ncbi:HIT family protein [Rappaport israeli]|uniref:HIT family protein n=1 Tax=Rappaport israeli TaxID=1839807 RepID=UPI0009312B1C|nr:HIT family protein [Rappaport israeli]